MYRVILTYLLCGAVLSACSPPQLSSRMTGILPDGPHYWQGEVQIVGDVEIPPRAQVFVSPGTKLLFMPAGATDRFNEHPHFPGSELIVRGRLVAEGTPSAPIEFRAVDPTAPPGSWGGLNLMASPGSRFTYCLFTQADSAIHSQESQVVVKESIFDNNLVGIRFHSSNILIEHNRLIGNGAAIRFHFGAPVIRNNLFEGNRKGLFITSSPRNYLIRGNLFRNNRPYNVVLGESIDSNVDLSGNSWAGYAQDDFLESFFDHRRDPALGQVLVDPVGASLEAAAGSSWSR